LSGININFHLKSSIVFNLYKVCQWLKGGQWFSLGKNMIFWRKIMIFHTKYPQNFRASLRSAHFF
jgi:hypothetical protein